MLIEPRSRTPVISVVHFFGRQHINVVNEDDSLATVLQEFSNSRQHFAMVRCVDDSGPGDPVYKMGGIITLEDIVEQILLVSVQD